MTLDQDLGRAALRLTTDETGLRRGLAAARSETLSTINGANQALQRAGTQMSATGQKLSLGVTLPILAAGKAIVDTGLDFDTTLRQVVGLAGVSASVIGGIKDRILELGGEVGKSPQELAEAFYFVASAGFEADEAMAVLETSAKASAAGLGRVQDVAKVLGLTINAYGHENITAARAADILTAAVRDGTAEADAFAGVLGRVVPTAAQMGVSFDQVTGSLAAMTITGLSADEAATSLNQVLVSLLKPTKEAEDALEGMGTSSADLRTELKEKGLLATLRDLEARFEGNDEAAAKVFGNVRALRGVLSLLGLDSEQLNDIFADTKGALGDLQEGYDATEGPARRMARAQAQLDTAMIRLSDDVLPIVLDLLSKVADIVVDAVDAFETLPQPVKDSVIQFAALAALAGPLLLFAGALATAATSASGLAIAAAPIMPLLLALAANLDKVNQANEDAAAIAAGGDPYKPIADFADKADKAGFLPIWLYDLGVSLGFIHDEAGDAGSGLGTFAFGLTEATAAIKDADLLPVREEYETLVKTVKTWREQTDAEHQKALTTQRDYTSDALSILRGFRKDIESAYEAAQDAALDFERTTVDIATKQAELTAADKEYAKHKGTMTKLEVAEYKLRRHEIIAELNALKLHAALIGDDMQKATGLQSLLTSKDMKDGLTSEMPETKAAYGALRDEALLQLQRIEERGGPAAKRAAAAIAKFMNPDNPLSPLNDAGAWGAEIGASYVGGIAGAIAHRTYMVKAALGGMRALLLAGSPPHSTENPLHEIDVWGHETGKSWVDRFLLPIEAAAARVRAPLDGVRRALAFGVGLPSGLTLAAAAAGAGGGFSRNDPGLPGPGAGGITINGGIHVVVHGAKDPEATGEAVKQAVGDAMAGVLRDESIRGTTGVKP